MLRIQEVLPVIGFWVLYTVIFSAIFIMQGNSEFMLYVSVLVIIASLLTISYYRGVQYSKMTLWLLAVWGFLHFLGGSNIIGETAVYNLMLYEILGDPYNILKYDQAVHLFGFFTTTLLVWDILKTHLQKTYSPTAVLFVATMASCGLGSMNEIIEFFATLSIENVNVGGYENTALDLIFNLGGAILAAIYLYLIKIKKHRHQSTTEHSE